MMVTYGKDFGGPEEPPGTSEYVRPIESNLEILIRIVGVITAISKKTKLSKDSFLVMKFLLKKMPRKFPT